MMKAHMAVSRARYSEVQNSGSGDDGSKASKSTSSMKSMKSKVLQLVARERRPTVALLRLSGNIADGPPAFGLSCLLNLPNLNKRIEKCFSTPGLQAVCLQINSPGGSPVQSELIAKRIRKFAVEKGVKVYAFIEDVGASGGYFLACAADEIYASESSIVGSIGVVSYTIGLQEAAAKLGIERRVRTAGELKVLADPLKEETDLDRARIDRVLKNIHAHFIDFVKTSRGDRIAGSDIFSGELWTGKEAASNGLIDGLDDAYSFINAKFGSNVRIVEPKRPGGLKALFSSESLLSQIAGAVAERIERTFLLDDVSSRIRITL